MQDQKANDTEPEVAEREASRNEKKESLDPDFPIEAEAGTIDSCGDPEVGGPPPYDERPRDEV